MAHSSLFAVLFAGSVLALGSVSVSAGIVSAAQAAGAPTRSTRDGVYSALQAERGKDLFMDTCAECHSGQLWGTDWNTKTVADVYEFIRQFMPEPAPGSLSAQQVRDAIAYILSSNGLPAGGSELPASVDDMKLIRIEPPAR